MKTISKSLLKLDGIKAFLQEGGNLPFYALPHSTIISLYMEYGSQIPVSILRGPSADETIYMFCQLDDLQKAA